MNPLHESHIRGVAVTFSVSAPDLDPDEATAATRLQPDSQSCRGDERRNRAGRLLRPEPEKSLTLGTRGKIDSKDVRVHFHYLHARLLPHAAALRTFAQGGEAYFDAFWKST